MMRALLAVLLFQLSLRRSGGLADTSEGADAPSPEHGASYAEVNALTAELSLLRAELLTVKSRLDHLTRQNSGWPQAAFSTSLGSHGHLGPFNSVTTVVYKNVFANVGGHYSDITGVFTAPVQGVYHFGFTVGGFQGAAVMGLTLVKNRESVIHVGEYASHTEYRYASNAVLLELRRGDVVFVRLPENYRIYDDDHNRNTFSGFLVHQTRV